MPRPPETMMSASVSSTVFVTTFTISATCERSSTGLSEAATQRYLPAEMITETSEGQRLEIRTDLEGEEISALGGFEETLRRIVSTVEGKETLRLYMSGPDAMSIFGLARPHPLIILKG